MAVTVNTPDRKYKDVVRIVRVKLINTFLDLYFENGTGFSIKENQVTNLKEVEHLIEK